MCMIHIAYMSRAVHPLSDQELQELLDQCRHANASHHVTGVLFYSHGNIAQLIEGEAEVLEPLFERIARDGRHSHVRKLVDRSINTRSFAEWSMAFHPLEPAGFAVLEGFLAPPDLPPTPSTLSIADALLVDLVRLAVFGTDSVAPGAAAAVLAPPEPAESPTPAHS
ncbi:MAG: BLUF domain-containing protein [Cytophagaceae bacterium]|nr:MAG: BLUF domain-containing protein [Cytophagaceae bacterium]